MQKKSFLLKFFVLLCITTAALLVVGCSHTHTAGVDWGATAGEHFHICSHQNCAEIMDREEHQFGEFVEYQAPTCTQSGSKSRECSVCGFTNWVTVNPLGHNFGSAMDVQFEFKKLQQPTGEDYWTCTATRECSRCDVIESETISTIDGKLKAKQFMDFGCGQDEMATFTNPQFEKSEFNQAFSQQNIRDVVTKKHTQEHNFDYSKITYTWAADDSYCVASVTCQNLNCGKKIEEESVSVAKEYFDATCTAGDYFVLTANFESEIFASTQKTVFGEKSPLGHTYEQATYTWAEDYSNCAAHNKCSTCGQTFDAVAHLGGTGNFVKYFSQQQTCFQNGYKKYVATFEQADVFPKNEKIVEQGAALEHIWGEVEVVWNVNEDGLASCTATVKCTREVNNTTCSGRFSYTIENIVATISDGKITYIADFTRVDTLPGNIKTLFGIRQYSPKSEE